MTETLLARSLRLAREIGSGGEQSPPSRITRLVRIYDGVTQVLRPQVLANRPSREQRQAEYRRGKAEIIRRGPPLKDSMVPFLKLKVERFGFPTEADPVDEQFDGERAEPARRFLAQERIDPLDMTFHDGRPQEWSAPQPEAWSAEVREVARMLWAGYKAPTQDPEPDERGPQAYQHDPYPAADPLQVLLVHEYRRRMQAARHLRKLRRMAQAVKL